MKLFFNLPITLLLLFIGVVCNGQPKNASALKVKIAGNCEMCKQAIENAANKKNIVYLDWNKDSKVATLSYDSIKTNPDEILKRVAYAGYDNEKFFAPDDAYEKLPSCCKYERKKKMLHKEVHHASETAIVSETTSDSGTSANQFHRIFGLYIELKNELIKGNPVATSLKAKSLIQEFSEVSSKQLQRSQNEMWMRVHKNLTVATEHISQSTDIELQRLQFISLSENMHQLIKAAKLPIPVYYQHCPMYNDGKGANWLSTESNVKNPYYGSQMLNCGKTVETIN